MVVHVENRSYSSSKTLVVCGHGYKLSQRQTKYELAMFVEERPLQAQVCFFS